MAAVASDNQGLLNYLNTPAGHAAITTQLANASVHWPGLSLWDTVSRNSGCLRFTQQVSGSGYPQPRIALPNQGAGLSARYYVTKMWASYHAGHVLVPGIEEGSHICGNPRCVFENHIVAESPELNKSRDSCRYFLFFKNPLQDPASRYVCPHQPPCSFAGVRAAYP